jgi:hypothetical protein
MVPPDATLIFEVLALDVSRPRGGRQALNETAGCVHAARTVDSNRRELSSAGVASDFLAAGARLLAVGLLRPCRSMPAFAVQHSAFGMFAFAGSDTLAFLSLRQPKASPTRAMAHDEVLHREVSWMRPAGRALLNR